MMNKILLSCMTSAAASGALAGDKPSATLVVAANSVPYNSFVMFDAAAKPEEAKVLWEWTPAKEESIAKDAKQVAWFGAPDECKVVDGGRSLLVCASGGGFAEVDIPTAKVKAFGNVHMHEKWGNPHSIEKLPDGRYALASSDGEGGNSITLIDVTGAELEPKKQKHVKAAFCYLAHGVEWDAERQSLWALGKTNIAEYAYSSESMTLTEKRSFALPSAPNCYGHDLYWAKDGRLHVTSPAGKAHCVYYFDRESGEFELSDISDEEIKAISCTPAGATVMMASDIGTCTYGWQSNFIRYGEGGEKPVKKGPYPWAAFYKVRFVHAYQR